MVWTIYGESRHESNVDRSFHRQRYQITSGYIERLPSDFQINLYAMALSRFLKRKITGVIYSVTRKASLKGLEVWP